MKFRFVSLLALMVLTTTTAFAHGDKKHVVGTLEKINADSVMVKTADGKSVEVKLAATTAFVSRIDKTDKPAKISDLAVGDRVVIHATPKGEILEADEIKFSPASAAHMVAPTAKKPGS
jgi:preprotein translocase subunit YajC